ncbi:MAG: penicillin-binding transpeptidase domain-containing protein, partial [Candidatus Poribacteria bacterium]|nr:penicillin-binding transpeptidase domain-containing protein [Candidatus Poribacteria bacterium]
GQGISVTPLQMLNTINTIATKGVLMQPYVVRGVLTHGNQEIERFHPQPIRRVMSPETATALTEILVQVTERGSGQNAQVDGYRVAGKTGTSQNAVANQGYVKGKVIASVAGFLPAGAPLISIIVVIDEPQGAPLSTQVAAPVFQKIAGQTVRHLTSIANRVADAASFPDSTDHPTFGLITQSDNY